MNATLESTGVGQTFAVTLKLLDEYAFRVDFDGGKPQPLTTDEPWPVGHDRGPSPSRLLAASVASCLALSLLHCLRKAHVHVQDLSATAVVTEARNADSRLRVERISVLLSPGVAPEHTDRLARCSTLFQNYCTVSESVRQGIDVRVSVATTDNPRTGP